MKCTNCRADLEGGAKYCTLCGHPVPEGVVPEDPKQFDFGSILNATKAFFASVWGKVKPACSTAWTKTKGAVKSGDEKLGKMLGDKKLYVYAGVIGLIGIIIVAAVIAGLIPNGNGYLTYDAAIALTVNDETVYMMKEGKAIALKTDAEDVDGYQTSIDGKVTVFHDDGVLYLIKGKNTKEIAEDVGKYTLSLYGDAIVYQVVDGLDITYHYRKLSSSKSVELFENELDSMILSYTISPDGKSVAYIASDMLDRDLYYFNGKKSEKVSECFGEVIGMSNGGKYIYTVVLSDDGKTSLRSYNKNGDDTKIDSCSGNSFALNLNGTEIMFYNNDKTYISTKAKEPVRVAGASVQLLTPAYTVYRYGASSIGSVYPVKSLYNHVYTSGTTAYYVSKNENKNVKLVKADSSRFTLDNSAKFLYYMEDDKLMVLEISKGDQAEDKAKTIAKDVDYYVVTSDRKYVYFVTDSELHVVNGKKGGRSTQLSDDDVSYAPAISKDDVVYYYCDDAVYATSGKKKGKQVLDDAEYGATGGYVYLHDEDALYAANGRSKPKKLFDYE